VEALKAAVTEAKAGNDVQRLEAAASALKPHLKPGDRDGILDQAWIERKDKQNKAESSRLEAELKGYKNNLIKESIRVRSSQALSKVCHSSNLHFFQMGNEDLGTHYHAIGDLTAATKAYGRMRDFCTTPAHIASTSFRLIEVAIDQKNWLAVQSAVHKVRSLQLKVEDHAKSQPKTQAAMGLYQLHVEDYRDAAISFLNTEPSLGDKYNEVLTSNDVAVYGGLCALASMDREELQAKVLDSASFRNFLELEPHIRRAINFFCAAKYTQCLDILEAYRADYLLDLHLQRHVPKLYARIRTKSIVQYFAPFSRVTLDSMAKTFAKASSNKPIEHELVQLVSSGTLKAKIDLEHRVLIADEVDLRAEVHREALESVKRFKQEAHQKLMRMEFVNAGMEIKAPLRGGGMGGGAYLESAGNMFSGGAGAGIGPGDTMGLQASGQGLGRDLRSSGNGGGGGGGGGRRR
jgi:COP9 signalosome complex subunit 1